MRQHRLLRHALTATGVAILAACGGGGDGGSGMTPIGADTTAPTIALTAPANLAAGLTGSITISATAGDNVGVALVEFQIDGVAIGAADTSAPFGTTLDTTAYPSDQHVLRARASDAAGNVSASATTPTARRRRTSRCRSASCCASTTTAAAPPITPSSRPSPAWRARCRRISCAIRSPSRSNPSPGGSTSMTSARSPGKRSTSAAPAPTTAGPARRGLTASPATSSRRSSPASTSTRRRPDRGRAASSRARRSRAARSIRRPARSPPTTAASTTSPTS